MDRLNTKLDELQEQAPPIVSSMIGLNRAIAERAGGLISTGFSTVTRSASVVGRVADHGGRTVLGTAKSAAERTASTAATGARRVRGQATSAIDRTAKAAESEIVDLSDEATARIDASGNAAREASLNERTKDDLYEEAQLLEIDGRSNMTKPELIAAIMSAEAASPLAR